MGTTAAQKKLFFNLRKLKGQMQAIEEGDLSPEHLAKIATELDVPEADVISMNRRLASPDHSLNAPLRQDGEGEWQDWLVDDVDNQEIQLADREELGKRRKLLNDAMRGLNERERHILFERRLRDNPTTLEDLSQHYNISRERVRQIEVRAFEKLQKAIKNAALEQRLTPSASVVATLTPAPRRRDHSGGMTSGPPFVQDLLLTLAQAHDLVAVADPAHPHGDLRAPVIGQPAERGGAVHHQPGERAGRDGTEREHAVAVRPQREQIGHHARQVEAADAIGGVFLLAPIDDRGDHRRQ